MNCVHLGKTASRLATRDDQSEYSWCMRSADVRACLVPVPDQLVSEKCWLHMRLTGWHLEMRSGLGRPTAFFTTCGCQWLTALSLNFRAYVCQKEGEKHADRKVRRMHSSFKADSSYLIPKPRRVTCILCGLNMAKLQTAMSMAGHRAAYMRSQAGHAFSKALDLFLIRHSCERTNWDMLFLGVWVLDSPVIKGEHAVERFIKDEELKAYV